MKNYYITFRSVTFAQKGEQILRRAGIDSILRRTPKAMTRRGCGYSLQLREKSLLAALEELQRAQLTYNQIFSMDPHGAVEEVTL